MNPVLIHADYVLFLISLALVAIKKPLTVIKTLVPYGVLLLLFGGFVIWNEGVVLGTVLFLTPQWNANFCRRQVCPCGDHSCPPDALHLALHNLLLASSYSKHLGQTVDPFCPGSPPVLLQTLYHRNLKVHVSKPPFSRSV